MKRYYKEENGKIVWFNKSVKLNGFQIFNPTEEQILSAGYVEYVEPIPVEPTDEETANLASWAEMFSGIIADSIKDYIKKY